MSKPAPPTEPGWFLAPHLRALLRVRGHSVTDLADLSGIARPALSRLLNGRVTPRAATLARVLEALGATHDDLLRVRPLPEDHGPAPPGFKAGTRPRKPSRG